MKSINNYITEKFKISKDIGKSEDFKKGDPILRIWISVGMRRDKTQYSEISIGFNSKDYLIYFDSFTKGRSIIFSYIMDYGRKIDEDSYSWEYDNGKINKYNIHEYHLKRSLDSNEITSLYLNKKDALRFFENIKFDINNITDTVLNNYFEQIPENFDIKKALNNKIDKKQNEMIKQIYTELKNDK